MGTRTARLITLIALSAAAIVGAGTAPPPSPAAGDAVVVAVIDSAINPYHLDLAASAVPDDITDLPLDRPPHEWLPGFPDPAQAFADYEALRLTLTSDPDALTAPLRAADAAAWARVQPSGAAATSYYWVPGTKVIGLVDFAATGGYGSAGEHGAKASSVAVGNLHGTCPSCLLVFLTLGTEAQAEVAIEWALDQPWIDVVTNSYGFSSGMTRGRDRIYDGSDLEAQRVASERGQTVFFSSGNGHQNDFVVPANTLLSSQEGPDWIVTVGATAPDGHTYSGSGKPVDVAGPGADYPSMGGATVGGTSTFGGTSNATPVVAGTYGTALWWARSALPGASRVQAGGVVAQGAPVACSPAAPDCELGDGLLTASELRRRVLHGAVHTPQGTRVGTSGPTVDRVGEDDFANEGHGTLWGRVLGPGGWSAELQRITGPLDGRIPAPSRPAGEAGWFVADSYCRQSIWGTWRDGEHPPGASRPLPDPAWPVRAAYLVACEAVALGYP